MPLYFMLLDAATFETQLRPALAASWRQRSFEPCHALARHCLQNGQDLLQQQAANPDEPLLAKVTRGLRFDRRYWTHLVGEVLLYGAAELPELSVAPETLCCILAPAAYAAGEIVRDHYPPILQAHFGARDLAFGGKLFRPESVGLNDRQDVARLGDYLQSIDPQSWTSHDLLCHRACRNAEERDEELADAQAWFPALQVLYQQAMAKSQVIICESLNPGREL